ncbi:MAG TPA: hypothetical protein PKN13_12705 [Accumulibacter sp.]|nr:hypothetical protein [Accumulibacter sp.]HMW18623.1 hypothetical protein [Accumulibacter sp.]HMX22124.1 hypothetical protein [Accumulibacter sp.]HMY07340.1 hypothetical protein [Accumulibacter sp.]HNC18681.1 hypothetical protein [Accumulibacter sp.]
MAKVTFPCYSSSKLEFWLVNSLFYGTLAIAILYLGNWVAVCLSLAILTVSVLFMLKFLTAPRTVEIDTSSGTVVLRGSRWRPRSKIPVIKIINFSAVYAERGSKDHLCFVGLSNTRGESITIIYRVEATIARNVCEFLSNNFGLRNLCGV